MAFAPLVPAELMRTPSTNTIGSLLCVSDALPRMRILMASPTRPLLESPTTPGSRPWSNSIVDLMGANFGGSIVATELPSRFTSVAPAVPVVTTVCSCRAVCDRLKSRVEVWPTASVMVRAEGAKPTIRTFTSNERAGTFVMR